MVSPGMGQSFAEALKDTAEEPQINAEGRRSEDF
jgi:hypothetical protein